MQQIIDSNHNEEWYNEKFILWTMSYDAATDICAAINKHQTSSSAYYYKVVDNDYKLYEGMQP